MKNNTNTIKQLHEAISQLLGAASSQLSTADFRSTDSAQVE